MSSSIPRLPPLRMDAHILIVGAGCFGISTAYHLLRRGHTRVTVLDRATVLPAEDAASTDLNKIVRSAYSDPFYTEFAREAIRAWKEDFWTGGTYHESGVLLFGSGPAEYTTLAYENDRASGARVQRADSPSALRALIPPESNPAPLDGFTGYLGEDGGWVESGRALELLTAEVVRLGGQIMPGAQVASLRREDGVTKGVACEDGRTFDAEKVVLAAGAWTAPTFEGQLGMGLEMRCLATGQTVAKIQLTDEEAARYRACPVVLDFGSGFYAFPPNADNVVKVAIHSAGFTQMLPALSSSPSLPTASKPISTPRTATSHGADGLRIPKSAVRELRTRLALVYPELARKEFVGTRLCWYTDSPDSAWHIGVHPADPGLFFATGGSGHAFKFFPVIGRLVADALEGTLDPVLARKFAVDRVFDHGDLSRPPVPPLELTPDELCDAADLRPQVEL